MDSDNSPTAEDLQYAEDAANEAAYGPGLVKKFRGWSEAEKDSHMISKVKDLITSRSAEDGAFDFEAMVVLIMESLYLCDRMADHWLRKAMWASFSAFIVATNLDPRLLLARKLHFKLRPEDP